MASLLNLLRCFCYRSVWLKILNWFFIQSSFTSCEWLAGCPWWLLTIYIITPWLYCRPSCRPATESCSLIRSISQWAGEAFLCFGASVFYFYYFPSFASSLSAAHPVLCLSSDIATGYRAQIFQVARDGQEQRMSSLLLFASVVGWRAFVEAVSEDSGLNKTLKRMWLDKQVKGWEEGEMNELEGH